MQKLYQPTGACSNCLKLDNDAYRNCPTAQAIRESGAIVTVRYCPKSIPLPSSNREPVYAK
jgi:hypothetical protein